MVAHAILFIVLPLAVAWFVGVTAYLPPYSLLPAPKTEPVEPQLEAEVRMFLAQHSEMDGAASVGQLAANDLPSGVQSRPDQEDLAA